MKLFEKLLAPNVGKLEGQRNVEALSKLVESIARPDLRIEAIEALSRIGGDEATRRLVASLSDDDPDIAAAAERAISALARIPTDELVANLGSVGGNAALRIISSLGEPAFGILAEAAKEQDDEARQRALDGLVALNNRLNTTDGREVFFSALLAALGDRSPQIRMFAAQQLEVLDDAKAGRGLAAQLRDGDEGVRSACRKALLSIGEPAVPHLLLALGDRNVNSKIVAAELLGEICSGDVDDNNRRIVLMELADRASDSNIEIAEAVSRAIEIIPSDSVINHQIAVLFDPEHSHHEEILEFLRQMLEHGKLRPAFKAEISEKIAAFEHLSGRPIS